MHYQALYRKYRPQRFDEVVGQDHVTTTLAREVIEDKVAHAYLFTGPRGTGKTTSARLLAKSLNCPDRDADGEPCNICPSCVGITEGTSLDVIELDAASHNKVEDVREIRVNVGTVAATPGARRVYILDEAHMLSRAASNALLKTLEEPPEHVVFVLATTEPYKLLDTIRSRTQRFDFQPVASEILIDYLSQISDQQGFEYDRSALNAVSAHAHGSVRDALSLLEQVAALGAGTVSTGGVSQALGLADDESYGRLVTAIHERDPGSGLTLVAELAAQGADLRRFVADSIGYLRGVFLAQYSSNIEEVADASSETITEWKRQAALVSSTDVLRSIDMLAEALIQLRSGREERLVVELAILKLTRPETVPDLESLTTRLDRTEREIRDLKRATPAPSATPTVTETLQVAESGEPDRPFTSPPPAASPPPPPPPTTTPTHDPPPEPTVAPEPITTGTATFTLEDFGRVWPAIVATIRQDVGPRRHALLREASPAAVEDGVVIFEVPAHMHFHLEQLRSDTGIATAIVTTGTDQLGQPVRVEFRAAGAVPAASDDTTERAPDKDDLLEAGDDGADDPATTVLDILGGEIVSDSSESIT
jgi:DNA polymerase-3 subunit gamma/tau